MMQLRYCALLVCALLFLALAGTQNAAYAAGGKVTGKVVDAQTGEPLPGATIMVDTVWMGGKPIRLDTRLGAVSDPSGQFFILNVPPGVYNIKSSMVGYTPLVQAKVSIETDRTITVNFKLTSAAIMAKTVEVVWEGEVIRPDVASTQEVIQTQRIEEMPVTRVDEFVGKLKGIELVDGADGHGISVRGGALRETDVRLDGQSLQDPRSEISYISLNSTTIQELQVLTGGFEAKYGGIQSGLLNVVTKEGSREKYNISLKFDMTPGGHQKFFGENLWGPGSIIREVFTGKYAMNGIQTHDDSLAVPSQFWGFKGWNHKRGGRWDVGTYPDLPTGYTTKLTPDQKIEIWKMHHPQYNVGTRPDIYGEGAITGPLPGADISGLGWYLGRTTFLLGFKYESSQFAFPVGPRDSYIDWNGQLKLVSLLTPTTKLSIDGMYASVSSINEGSASTYGGALVEASSSFNFLNNTQNAVRRQAQLIGGANLDQIYNKSRFQFYDQRYITGGARLTNTLSPTSFFTVNAQFGYNDHKLKPFELDTSSAAAFFWVDSLRFLNVPAGGSPNASTNFGYDELNMFRMYGGTQRDDSSYSWSAALSGDFTAQLGSHNQIEAGVSGKLTYLHVYGGTWLQSQRMWSPDLWQYYNVTPIELGAYAQDKLEFQGMILKAGLRLDVFDPDKAGFIVTNPPDPAYAGFYNSVYSNLPGGQFSYERWLTYRDLLANPPGWPESSSKIQVKLSPRLAVSFPVTVNSKLYFNYGHFYQRPPVSFLYNLVLYPNGATIPTPGLEMGRTVSYEFGYEQRFLQNFLVNVAFYYKDVRNQPLSQTFYSYYQDNVVTQYVPGGYRDIRGVEARFERSVGRFVTFWANYDYMIQSSGQTGVSKIYENQIDQKDVLRSANVTTTTPLPRAHINFNLHSPSEWGPEIVGVQPLSDIFVNLFWEWRSGGQMLWNPTEPDVKKWQWLDVVNYSNMDLRASKMFKFGVMNLELVLTIQNVLNQKRLEVGNMSTSQLDAYKNSLHLPFYSGDKKGNDKWGEWDKDYIKILWPQAPLFLNPQNILLGVRIVF